MKKEIRHLPVYLALICVYFYDVFLKGSLLAVEDGIAYHYPMMIAMSEQYRNFIFPFWNPYEYSGFPLMAAIEPGALYPFNIILPLLFDPSLAFNFSIMLHYALAGFFTYLYAREIGLDVYSSFLSGTVFSLLGYLPSHLNHQSVIASGVWIPLLLFIYERLKKSFQMKYAIYAAVIIALQIFAGHPQISFYTHLLIFFYAVFTIFYLERAKRLRFGLLYAVSVISGFLLALPQIVATYELAGMGMRAQTTYEFFSSYSFPAHMLPTFLFPFFYYFGGPSGQLWSPDPIIGQEAFVGTFPFLLALAVIVRWKKNPLILFWWLVAIVALILALGDAVGPLNRLLYHLPVFNAFRAHSKFMILVSLALCILAGFGLSLLMDREKEQRFTRLMVLFIFLVVTTFAVAFTFFHGALRDFFIDAFSNIRHFDIRSHRTDVPDAVLYITNSSIYTPIIFMFVYLVFILAYFKTDKKNLQKLLLAVIALTVFVEAMSWKMTGIPKKADVENYNRGLYSILSSHEKGRTVFLSGDIPPLTAMPYGIRLADGYESLETSDYTKIFPRMYLQPPRTWRLVLENNSLLSMLNVKYLVVSRKIDGIDEIRRQVQRDREGRIFPIGYREGASGIDTPIYREIASFTSTTLYENRLVLPRAYSITKLKAVSSPDDLRRSLFSYRFHPWTEAAVSAEDLHDIGYERFTYGTVTIGQEKPDMLIMTAKFDGEGFVVLSDQYYPGWKAYIDGNQTRIYKTNGVLRGIIVPQGEHEIVFKYVPLHIYVSMLISGIFLAVMMFVLLKKRGSNQTNSLK